MGSNLNTELSKKTPIFGIKVWEIIAIVVALSIIVILSVFSLCLTSRKKSRKARDKIPVTEIPNVSKEITEVRVEQLSSTNGFVPSDRESDKVMVHLGVGKMKNGDSSSHSDSFHQYMEKDGGSYSQSGEESSCGTVTVYKKNSSSSYPLTAPSPLCGLPEFSHLGWGHWFTLRDLELATNRFAKENVLGEGGYGVVYKGHLINGSPVAVKKILNNT